MVWILLIRIPESVTMSDIERLTAANLDIRVEILEAGEGRAVFASDSFAIMLSRLPNRTSYHGPPAYQKEQSNSTLEQQQQAKN